MWEFSVACLTLRLVVEYLNAREAQDCLVNPTLVEHNQCHYLSIRKGSGQGTGVPHMYCYVK